MQLNLHPNHPCPSWFRDVDVQRALYDAVNGLRVKAGRTKAKRAEMNAKLVPFDAYVSCFLAQIPTGKDPPHESAVYFSFSHWDESRAVSDWLCRLYYDYTIYTGLSSWRFYDGRPLVNPARTKWRAVVKRVSAMAKVVTLWRETAAAPDSMAVSNAAKRFKAMC